jgi:PAS domain S-box-containing protein
MSSRIFSRQNRETDEEIAKNMLDAIPMAVLALENRRIKYANASVEKVFGWKKKELLGKTTELLYRDHQEFEEIGKNFYSKLKNNSVHREIFPGRCKNGNNIICDITATRLGESLSANKGVVVVYDDITVRIEAEKELERSEETYRTYIENAHDIVLNITPQGKILSGNQAGYKIFGYDKKEFNDSKIEKYIDPVDKKSFQKAFQDVVVNRLVKDLSMRFLTKNGKTLYLEGNLVPRVFYDKVITITAFYRDQTEKILTQNEIKEKISELERFNNLVVDREIKMIELKKQIIDLKKRLAEKEE